MHFAEDLLQLTTLSFCVLQISLNTLQTALSRQFENKHCPILLLCCGEVYAQAGDMVTGLELFQKAHKSAPNNPLCYVNAARTYQQLNQVRELTETII